MVSKLTNNWQTWGKAWVINPFSGFEQTGFLQGLDRGF